LVSSSIAGRDGTPMCDMNAAAIYR
jgi:hypothetical protein